jgi:hypothetical protein
MPLGLKEGFGKLRKSLGTEVIFINVYFQSYSVVTPLIAWDR